MSLFQKYHEIIRKKLSVSTSEIKKSFLKSEKKTVHAKA